MLQNYAKKHDFGVFAICASLTLTFQGQKCNVAISCSLFEVSQEGPTDKRTDPCVASISSSCPPIVTGGVAGN